MEEVQRRIKATDQQVSQALKEIEDSFCNSIQSHITYHQILEDGAKARGDDGGAAFYGFKKNVYQQILDNYLQSKQYSTV